jgi:hypothetical protein
MRSSLRDYLLNIGFCTVNVGFLLGTVSCDPIPATAIVIAVDSDEIVQASIRNLRIQVTRNGEARFEQTYNLPSGMPMPGTLTVYSHDGNTDGPLTISLSGFQTENDIRIQRVAQLSYVKEKTKLLRLPLVSACLDVECVEGTTCSEGFCIGQTVDVEKLPNLPEITDPTVNILPSLPRRLPIELCSPEPTALGKTDYVMEQPSSSGDGNFVVFASTHPSLVAGTSYQVKNIYLYDRAAQKVSMISEPLNGQEPNGDSDSPSISLDGRYISFASKASNLVPDDTNQHSDIFVVDRKAQLIERVSVSSSQVQGNNDSMEPQISSNGRFVVYASTASNLIINDSNSFKDIFVYDRQTQLVVLASVGTNGQNANGDSSLPKITANGEHVVFQSDASNLVDGDGNGQPDIFQRKLFTNQTLLISKTLGNGAFSGPSLTPAMDGSGNWVVFSAQNITIAGSEMLDPAQIYVRNVAGNQSSLVSHNAANQIGNGSSINPNIDATGHVIVFESEATNLIPTDNNGKSDIFATFRQTNLIARISVGATLNEADGPSHLPHVSANGGYVTFVSSATNLVSNDTNPGNDVFEAPTSALFSP